ncbi:MAG: hypothetical protein K5925_06420 [Bacilli bacterium]|nr:hypothetical protein [Bacilli bacterium]
MNEGLMIFLIVLGVAAFLAIVAFLIRLYIRPKLKIDNKPTEEQIVEEEMNRILKPVDDEKTAEEIEDYKDEEE